MKMRAKPEESSSQYKCHVCKTFTGDVAKALYELVRRGFFPSYSAAVAQAVVEYYRHVIREDLELSRLSAISKQDDEEA
jgi:hypothetical protein